MSTKRITIQFEVTENVDPDLFVEAITNMVHNTSLMSQDQIEDMKSAVIDVEMPGEIGHEEFDEYFKEDIWYMNQMEHSDLGALLTEYVSESAHSGWEGYEPHEQWTIYNMLKDMVKYFKNRGE